MKRLVIILSILTSVILVFISTFEKYRELKKEDGRKKNDPTKAREAKAVKPIMDELIKEQENEKEFKAC